MSPTNISFFVFDGLFLGLALLQLSLVKSGLQHVHSDGPVFVLRTLRLALYDNARGLVGDADSTVSGIDVLAPSTRGTIGIDT